MEGSTLALSTSVQLFAALLREAEGGAADAFARLGA